ncbi:hypothetical protein GCM10007923_40800 [Shinella yambaruensis]|uniref:Uncharacterized protein n=1 Tax=Shinella yambaruensis TaxID=415996 RepID=A0ABQ5ZMH0_9HYPH|nr:hypothetical protein GCM10007923_40800 [Shinella yambaruensis]
MAGADIAADTSSIMIIRFISARRLGAAPVHKPLRNTIVPRRDLHVFYGETAEWSVNAAFMCRKSGTAVRSWARPPPACGAGPPSAGDSPGSPGRAAW